MTIYIDGGATSTKVYYKEADKLKKLLTTNRVNIATSETQTIKNIIDCFEQIDNEMDTKNNFYYLGIPGFVNYDENKILKPLFSRFKFLNKKNIKIMLDVEMQLYLNIGDNYIDENFIYIVCGTGSNTIECYDKKIRTIGGWGYFLGDEGSAYDFSREWIIYSLMSFDRKEKNKFTEAVCNFFNIKEVSEIMQLYKTPYLVKNYFADLCVYIVEENHKKYQEEIDIIMEKTATNIANYLNSMINFVKHQKVYFFGGLFKSEAFEKTIAERISNSGKIEFVNLTKANKKE